jgi:hypothetical protein
MCFCIEDEQTDVNGSNEERARTMRPSRPSEIATLEGKTTHGQHFDLTKKALSVLSLASSLTRDPQASTATASANQLGSGANNLYTPSTPQPRKTNDWRRSTQYIQDATLQQTRRRRRSLTDPKPPSSTTNPRPRIPSTTQPPLATLKGLSSRQPQIKPTHSPRAIKSQLLTSPESTSQSHAPESSMARHTQHRLHSKRPQSRYTTRG